MADKKFGVKQLNLIGASGTPVITSPNTLNINATNVAISTDMTIGGTVNSNITVGTGYTFYGDGSGLTGTAPSRVIVSGATTSIVNSGIGNTDITGFKSYMLMRVGLSTADGLDYIQIVLLEQMILLEVLEKILFQAVE